MDRRTFLHSLALVGVTATSTYALAHRTRFSGGSYVQMGTSVTAGVTPTVSTTPAVVGDLLGMLAIKAGLHGAAPGKTNIRRPRIARCTVL